MTERSGRSERSPRLLGGVAILGAAVLWLPPLMSSFWMDETVTHWIVRDGWSDLLDRSLEFEGESPFYFLIVGGVRRLLGSSELALRLPSLIAVSIATVLVWRLGRRIIDSETGALAAVAFVAAPAVVFAAGDARSYGLALLAVVASTLALVRWAETGSKRDALLYVILTAAALYLHYFTLTALAVHPIYAWWQRKRLPPRHFILAMLAIALLMIPTLPHLTALLRRRGSLELPHDVTLELFLTALFPPLLIGGIVFGLLIARFTARPGNGSDVAAGSGAGLAAALWLIPPTVLAGATILGMRVFEGRYLFFATPGLALSAGVLLRLAPAPARRIAAVSIGVVGLIALGSTSHTADDWPTAAAIERSVADPGTPVLFRSTLVESAQIDWLSRPEKVDYLLAVRSPYPLRGQLIVIPHSFTPDAVRYLERIVPQLRDAPRFVLLKDQGPFARWLEGRLPDHRRRDVPGGGSATVSVFEKQA